MTSTLKIKTTDEYTKHEAEHRAFNDAHMRFLSSFFTKLRKKAWRFDCSVQTDGVSLSRQFSRERLVERRPTPKTEGPTVVEDYQKRLSCFVEALNTLVIGLDPGRVNVACLSYIWIKDNGEIEKKSWSLTRAHYYSAGGITLRSQKKAQRFSKMAESWSKLGTLKATQSSEIEGYVRQYNVIKDEWWCLALNKVESKNALLNYSGKKSVLNRFFAKVNKEVKVVHPEVNIVVAYGSAHNGMSSTGKGEVPAPVGETYRTCCQHFDVQVQDENFTTKKSFETGKEMMSVYKTFREEDGTIYETFGHCKLQSRPQASSKEDKDALIAYYENVRKKKKKRWKNEPDEEPPKKEEEKEKKQSIYFPLIRGLQFCPETRKYVDRDVKASLTIARLAVMRITKNERPKAFVRETKVIQAGGVKAVKASKRSSPAPKAKRGSIS